MEIDNTLELTTDENDQKFYKNKKGIIATQFKECPEDGLASITYEDYTLSWDVAAKAVSHNGIAVQANSAWSNENKADSLKIPENREFLYYLNSDSKAYVLEGTDENSSDKKIVKNAKSSIEYPNVLNNIDFKYTVSPTAVKEDIIIKEYNQFHSFITTITTNGLSPRLCANNSVEFKNAEDPVFFTMPAPFMFDSDQGYSEDITVKVNLIDQDTCQIVITPDQDWLSDADRAYPVTIDPTFSSTPALSGPNVTVVTYIYSGDYAGKHRTSDVLKVGGGK